MARVTVSRQQWLVGVLLSVLVGGLVSIQSIANGTLRVRSDDPFLPSLANFVIAGVIIAVIVLVQPSRRAHCTTYLRKLRSRELPWLVATAGLFGIVFSVAQATSVAIIGVAVFTVAVIAGQNLGGLGVDRLGLSGTGVFGLDPLRIVAAIVATVAVVMAVLGRIGSLHAPIMLVLFVIVGGVCVSVQLALSGRITVAVQDPFVASLNVFIGGTLGLLIAIAVHSFVAAPHFTETIAAIASAPWLIVGGLCAAVMMTASAIAVPRVGVLVFTMATVIGQLLLALIIDTIVGTPTDPLTLVIACVLTVASVIMAGRSASKRRKESNDASRTRAVPQG